MPRLSAIVAFVSAGLLAAGDLAAPAAAPCASPAGPGGTVNHHISVRLDPGAHRIELKDEIRFAGGAAPAGELRFALDAGLHAETLDPAFVLEALHNGSDPKTRHLRSWRLKPAGGSWPRPLHIRLRVSGEIHHPPSAESEEYARGFSRSSGTIQTEGALLSGATGWIPVFGEELLTFDLEAIVPASWDVISQGRRLRHELSGGERRVLWRCERPMDEVYLVAGAFTEYRSRAGATELYAFLRKSDAELAERYFDAAASYLPMYGDLIGDYPYAKFALIENFWETGYGMPSFTLLGAKIIRFPFILHSSYPHEILHNWWGNSVYVAPQSGNWSEGLTAYLADHLIKEGRGGGAEYRRDTLARYRSYVRDERDFPLSDFRARHSASTEAVGYGKSLMLWHMLRRRIGDDAFRRGLQEAYRRLRFTRSSFDDFAGVFSEVAGRDLRPFFDQWVSRTGAPELSLDCAMTAPGRLRLSLRQQQPGAAYDLLVPLALTLAGRQQARLVSLHLDRRERDFELEVAAPVLRADLDPEFDLFRRLAAGEVPLSLGDLFGAASVTIVQPRDEAPELREAWAKLARTWSRQAAGAVRSVDDDAIGELPADGAVWLLGRRNRWAGALDSWLEARGGRRFGDERIRLAGKEHSLSERSTVVVGRPSPGHGMIGWISASKSDAVVGLARKLPHYGRYSYLAFGGREPENLAKGQWQPLASPLAKACGGGAVEAFPARGYLPVREPLARPAPRFDVRRMAGHVRFLAADELEGRAPGSRGIDRAADYIAEAFRRAGLEPGGDGGTFYQDWEEQGGPNGKSVRLRNVVGVLRGKRADWSRQSVVLGAHYDHLGRGWPDHHKGDEGKIHNGADDNASGVAVLIEVAAALASGVKPDRSIVFVAFSGEEWGRRGSRHYLRAAGNRAAGITAMVNLDTVGRMNSGGLAMLGAGSASEWPHIAMGVGYTTGIEAKAVQNDPGGSDQKSFLERGIAAVQLFTGAGPDYHRPGDDADKVEFDGLVKVATFTREVLVYLAAREQPLHSIAAREGGPRSGADAPAPERRRASLGTVPDYTYDGRGVRIAEVVAGSAAARAGIVAGDLLVAFGEDEISDLRAFAAVLRRREAGERVRLTVRRDGREVRLEATLDER